MAILQYPDSTIELFISSTCSPEQHVKVNGILRALYLDPMTMGDGSDEGLPAKLKPPLFETSDRIIHWCRGVDCLEVERTVVSDGVHKLRLVEGGETSICYLVANETGHFCYHVADASELVAALLVSVAYRSGFHLCILSRGTVWHSVRAFGKSVEVNHSICFCNEQA